MSAETNWYIRGPDGQRRKVAGNLKEFQEFLRSKERTAFSSDVKTPPPARFVEPAHRAPSMCVSAR
jgi:hypothetical protein